MAGAILGINYGLPENYQARLEPQYFNDVLTDAHLWQADVYRLAVKLARDNGIKRIVDIGCGRGGKLLPLASEFKIVGIDYGENIQYLSHIAPAGEWIPVDLENEVLPSELFFDSVVICADVIEHLVKPDLLIETLRNAAETAAYVLVSTPDRERLYGDTNHSPPDNLAHVREWTLDELDDWFMHEELPVRWAGWTVSFDNQPDRVNTILLILDKNTKSIEIPITFQPVHRIRTPDISTLVQPVPTSDLLKVWMTPTPSEAGRDITNAINQIVVRVNKYLPEFGVELVEQPDRAHLFAGHAGQGSQGQVDVAHFHGLYPTAQGSDNYAINKEVIRNLRSAYRITAPSQWIADVIRRDMHVEPAIIGWGVDTDEWTPLKSHANYVIWNKARVDNVSNPQPMLDLAARAHDVLFLTTFGAGTPNVKTIGRQPYEVMKNYVRNAAVYLSTNVETFGIGLFEAMSAGVPVLGFRQGAQADYIQHGIHGFLAEPGDLDGLYKGLVYCMAHRERLGANARELAKHFTWRKVAEGFAGVYHEVMAIKGDMRPHQIDPSSYRID